MRALLTPVLRFVLRVFYRKVEVVGLSNLPGSGPTILVLNHPNGLLDPVVLLCLSPRPVSFLGKEPLFRMPVLGTFVRALDTIPVYRQQDTGGDTAKNAETFTKARALLARGGVLALFPEGVSHDDPKLRPLKTGAARIALGAAHGGERPLLLVPAGLTYTAKETFRSEALMTIGPPITVPSASSVPPVHLEATGEPPREAVTSLTARIEEALRGVTLQADEREALRLVEKAETIFSAEERERGTASHLADRIGVRRLMLERWAGLKGLEPARVAALEHRVRRLSDFLAEAGLAAHDLDVGRRRPVRLAAATLATAAMAAVLLPFALAGLVTHYPAYRLVGFLSGRLSKGEVDVVSTMKCLGALVFFPVTWLLATFAMTFWLGRPGLLSLLVLPLCGWAALVFSERLERFVASARAVALALFRSGGLERLLAERRAIHEEMLALEAEGRETPGSEAP